MTPNRLQLTGPINRDRDVEFVVAATTEAGPELVVEKTGHPIGDRPGQHRHLELVSRAHGRFGGRPMIGVTRHAALVEDQQPGRSGGGTQPDDMLGEFLGVMAGDRAIRVVEQLHPVHTQHNTGGDKLVGPDRVQLAGDRVQRRGLTVGETQQAEATAGSGERDNTAPRPKDSSSGCAHTTNTLDHSGNVVVLIPLMFIAHRDQQAPAAREQVGRAHGHRRSRRLGAADVRQSDRSRTDEGHRSTPTRSGPRAHTHRHSPSSPARIILDDERRHHQLLNDLAESIRIAVELTGGPTPIPDLAMFKADRDRILAQTEEFLGLEKEDNKKLNGLAKELEDVRDAGCGSSSCGSCTTTTSTDASSSSSGAGPGRSAAGTRRRRRRAGSPARTRDFWPWKFGDGLPHHRLVTERFVDHVGLEVLDRAECLRLLEGGGVGRIAIAGQPPIVRPVNFVLDRGRIVIRTGDGSLWRAASEQQLATFEIDGVRNVDHRGWSVLAGGPLARLATDERTVALPLRAWAPRGRDRFIAITIVKLSGRRLTGRS